MRCGDMYQSITDARFIILLLLLLFGHYYYYYYYYYDFYVYCIYANKDIQGAPIKTIP